MLAHVHAANIPQVDLIGMRHGFTVATRVDDERGDGWRTVTLTAISGE